MIEWRAWNSRYEVSSDGKVRSTRRKKLIRQQTSHNGYRQVKLAGDDGTRCWMKVHLLVLSLFVGPRPTPKHHGAHAPDRNKRNNRVENLRWALPNENEADKKAHGTARGGTGKRLTKQQVAEVRLHASLGRSFTRIAKMYGIHRHSVSRVVNGRKAS